MQFLLEIFSNREFALLVWSVVTIIALLFNKEIRISLARVIRTTLDKKIITMLILLIAYVSGLVIFLHSIGFWEISLLKDTIFWFLTMAVISTLTLNKAQNTNYFKKTIKESLKWTIILEYLLNFYTFSLVIELILLPIIVILSLMQVFSETDKKYELTSAVLKKMFVVLGLGLFAFVMYKTILNYNELLKTQTLLAFVLPPLLSILLIPFLYLYALYINYEVLMVRINFMIKPSDIEKKRILKKQIFLSANFNLNKLSGINQRLNNYDIFLLENDQIKSYIKNLV